MAVNLIFNNNEFPSTTKGRPQLESWYTRQAFMPDVGLGGFDLGLIADTFLPASFPAKNAPIRYKTVRRQDPVVIPKGKLVTSVQIQNSYSAEDIEIGVATDGSFVTSYDENTNNLISENIGDYDVYGEDSRYVMEIANATSADVSDSYTAMDDGRIGLLSDGASPATYTAKIIGESTNGNYNIYSDANLKFVRKSHKPIGYVEADVYADVRKLYQYFSYDQTFRLKKAGSIAIPYVKADGGTTFADADLQPGGTAYDYVTNLYAFMPILTASGFNAYDAIYGDFDGNYVLDSAISAFDKVGYTMYYDTIASKGINWQIMTPNGSNSMGTDTFGIETRLYKFITVLSKASGKAIDVLAKYAMDGNIGMAYIYVSPMDY